MKVLTPGQQERNVRKRHIQTAAENRICGWTENGWHPAAILLIQEPIRLSWRETNRKTTANFSLKFILQTRTKMQRHASARSRCIIRVMNSASLTISITTITTAIIIRKRSIRTMREQLPNRVLLTSTSLEIRSQSQKQRLRRMVRVILTAAPEVQHFINSVKPFRYSTNGHQIRHPMV